MQTATNTATATAFHQQVQAALPAGCQANTAGTSYGLMSATVYATATGEELTCCLGDAATVLAQIEAQRAELAHLSR